MNEVKQPGTVQVDKLVGQGYPPAFFYAINSHIMNKCKYIIKFAAACRWKGIWEEAT